MLLDELGGEPPRAQISERLLRFLALPAKIDACNGRQAAELTVELPKTS